MGKKKEIVLLLPAIIMSIASGCSNHRSNSASFDNSTGATGYIAISSADCYKTSINGHWQLINIKEAGKNKAIKQGESISIADCTRAAYFSAGTITHIDTFKMYRVIQYCADYQLIYNKNDSISCINFRKDTLIIGACNDNENTRYYYKRKD